MLDKSQLAEVARKGPEPIFATISGAHLYGFASPDSDVDLRGAFMLPAGAIARAPRTGRDLTMRRPLDFDRVAQRTVEIVPFDATAEDISGRRHGVRLAHRRRPVHRSGS